jgi:hypothetical protein
MGGVAESRIFCPTEFLFDVTVRMETSDGALAEEWRGRARYGVSGTLGADGIEVEIPDPRPFAGTLKIEERDGLEQEWESRELLVNLYFNTYPLDFLGLHGEIWHHVSNTGAGEGTGAITTIAEFRLPPS